MMQSVHNILCIYSKIINTHLYVIIFHEFILHINMLFVNTLQKKNHFL